MLNIENLFYSFRLAEVPKLADVFATARTHSVIPQDFDPDYFVTRSDAELNGLRRSLDRMPDEDSILRAEEAHSIEKWREFSNAASKRAAQAKEIPAPSASGSALDYAVKQGFVSFGGEGTRLADVATAVADLFGEPCRVQGDFYYPRLGFRTWHTNRFDPPGWRMYIVDVDVPRRSYFRVKVPATGELHTEWDEEGTVNFFLIDPTRVLWHCIGSETNRWSKGFKVPSDWQCRVL